MPAPAETTAARDVSSRIPAFGRPGERVPLYVYALVAAIVLQFMSGSAHMYGVPFPPDRAVLALALVMFVVHPDLRAWRWQLRGIHLVLFAALAGCVGSMLWFGTITEPTTVFKFLDAYGAVPFLLFVLSPVIFATARRREVLFTGLMLLGLYLGWVSVAAGLHLPELVWPRGIYNPAQPHFPRAVGPSGQVANNGLQLLGCAAASGAVFALAKGARRWLGALSLVLCLAGAFFTLTRSIWLGAVFAVIVAAVLEPRLRLRVVAAGSLAAAVLAVLLVTVPAVSDQVFERVGTSRSVYDRLNVNEAAIRAVGVHPLEGVGYNKFHQIAPQWVWQAPDYPITAVDIAVHNVFLGQAVELGIPLTIVWLAALVWAALLAIRGIRTASADRADVRVLGTAVFAYAAGWLLVANFIPIGYSLPTTMLWVGLGVCTRHDSLGFTRPDELSNHSLTQ